MRSNFTVSVLLLSPDTLLSTSRATRGRLGKSHSSGLLDEPDDEEYEYMNKQACVISVSPRHNSRWLKPNKKRTSSTSSQTTACSGDTMTSMELGGNNTTSTHNSDSEQQGSSEVEYEYMDIRGDKDESPPAHVPPLPPHLTPAEMGRELADGEDEEDEYVEDSNYHYTNQQPKLRQALQLMKPLKIERKDEGPSYEYEDMDSFATMRPEDAAVYQNLLREGEGAAGGTAAPPSGFEAYVKVQAGIGVREPAAVDSSFDNPDYWHSRMFLKPNAVTT